MKCFNLCRAGSALTMAMALLISVSSIAQAPKTLTYQGKLSDGGGPLNGTYNLTFAIYDMATGGTALWMETSSGVSVTAGNVSLILGKTNPIAVATDKPLWLGITVGANPEVSPRVELTGSLYSLGLALPFVHSSSRPESLFSITATADGARAGEFTHQGINSGQAALFATSTGGNLAFQGLNSGSNEGAASLFTTNPSNPTPTLRIYNNGGGPGAQINLTNTLNTNAALQINHSGTGNAITANRPIEATQFIGDGSLLTNLPGGFSIPYTNLNTDAPASSSLFTLQTNSSANNMVHVAKFENLNPTGFSNLLTLNNAGTGASLQVFANGTGSGGIFSITNPSNTLTSLRGQSSGMGRAGLFSINNASNTVEALGALTNGLGSAGNFSITNASNSAGAIVSNTNGSGAAIIANTTGLGNAANFGINNALNNVPTLNASSSGLGTAGNFYITNTSNSAPVVSINHAGTGNAITANRPIQATQFIGDGSLLTGLPSSGWGLLGNAGTNPNTQFIGTSDNNDFILRANNLQRLKALASGGVWIAGTVTQNQVILGGSDNTGQAVFAYGGSTFYGNLSNDGGVSAGNTETGSVSGIPGRKGGRFFTESSGSENKYGVHSWARGSNGIKYGLYGTAEGIGTNYGVYGSANGGTSNWAGFFAGNTAITGALAVGPSISAGTAGQVLTSNGPGVSPTWGAPGGLVVPANIVSNYPGNVFRVEATADGARAGEFVSSSPSAGQAALFAISTGGNMALYAQNSGTNSSAGTFQVSNTNSYGSALVGTSNSGISPVMSLTMSGSAFSIADFYTGSTRVARIDRTGKGYFNGGTQTGGADVAEMFDVEGSFQQYEPGDVLVISEDEDRTVEKSFEPNSTKIAGVYATKPGVVLTERDIESNLDGLIPMGVVGVIPTKVCNQNGVIKRGDLLVTSSVTGHAMKAIPVEVNGVKIYPTGAILGKALENFEGNHGMIKVLVNVK